jgi:pimeloyl-ACP methyl ester carboxylesterase
MLDVNKEPSLTYVEERYIQVGPFRTRVLCAGKENTPTLLLLHDGAWGGCSSVTWGGMIPRLAQTYRVIAPDMLGFGGTDKAVFVDRSPYDFRIDHIISLLELLGVEEKMHVIGSSFGGSLALQMISQRAERLASVATISGTGGPWRTVFGRAELAKWDGTIEDIGRITRLLCGEGEGFDMDAHIAERFKWSCAPGHYRAMAAPAVQQPAALPAGPKPDDAWLVTMAKMDIPVMLVAGKQDRLVEEGWTKNLEPHIPRCKAVLLDSMHSPNLDHPDTTRDLLTDWVASCI